MKLTATRATAYIHFRKIVLSYYRGLITYREMQKAIFKAVAQHRYGEVWLDFAGIAQNSNSVADYEARTQRYLYEAI